MVTNENVLFGLVRHLLEYALKTNNEYLVTSIAANIKRNFSAYGIGKIRFELFNMYFAVKYKRFERFGTVIQFLNEFDKHFPNTVPEILLIRVVTSLKALHIYELLKRNDLKIGRNLIKEYFPLEFNYQSSPCNKGKENRAETGNNESPTTTPNFEIRLLKLRTHWKELILDESKRRKFFDTQFKNEFNESFLDFLLVKVIHIITLINSHLPATVLEKLINENFKNCYVSLFGVRELNLELEDDVRVELFLENLKLHQLYLNKSNLTVYHHSSSLKTSKYAKKVLKLVIDWHTNLNKQNGVNCESASLTSSSSSASPPASNEVGIRDMLYLDSRLDNFSLDDLDRKQSQNHHSNEWIRAFWGKYAQNRLQEGEQSAPTSSGESYASAASELTSKRPLPATKTGRFSNPHGQLVTAANDMITDDEKENE